MANVWSQTSLAAQSRRAEIRGGTRRTHSRVLASVPVTYVSGRLVDPLCHWSATVSCRQRSSVQLRRLQLLTRDLARERSAQPRVHALCTVERPRLACSVVPV